MASLTIGLPTHTAIMVGFVGACCWIIHAIARDDKPLLFVNTAVLATARGVDAMIKKLNIKNFAALYLAILSYRYDHMGWRALSLNQGVSNEKS